jgi:hypothetical protein
VTVGAVCGTTGLWYAAGHSESCHSFTYMGRLGLPEGCRDDYGEACRLVCGQWAVLATAPSKAGTSSWLLLPHLASSYTMVGGRAGPGGRVAPRSRLHEGGIGHVLSRSAEYLRTSCSHLELTKNTVSIPEWRWRWRSEGASRGGLAGSCHVPMRHDGGLGRANVSMRRGSGR